MADGHVHRVFLIRHGETVDNIAGLYAGVRDSALTTHGVLQAEKLGHHLTNGGVVLTHLFSSDLSRAFRTAEAIRNAQSSPTAASLTLTQCEELREQDFGHFEGKPFMVRKADSKLSAKVTHAAEHQEVRDIQPMETKEAMAVRANLFLDQNIIPLLESEGIDKPFVIAIVSHGMLLSSLWKAILQRQQPHSVALAPDVLHEHGTINLEHLGGWSNTGYLELSFRPCSSLPHNSPPMPGPGHDTSTDEPCSVHVELLGQYEKPTFSVTIHAVNGKEHLKGLKRTRGGVGSSKHDEKQRSLHSFFNKKPKLG